jgi:hypothetical protein
MEDVKMSHMATAVTEKLIKASFATMGDIRKQLDEVTRCDLMRRVEALFPFPYFYATARLVDSDAVQLFTVEHLIAAAALYRFNMPEQYEMEALTHQLRVNFVVATFDESTDLGIYSMYKQHRSISWLLWLFHRVVDSSPCEQLDCSANVCGMDPVMPYGVTVWVRECMRGNVKTYVTGFPLCAGFPTGGEIVAALPPLVRDLHDALEIVSGFGCPVCDPAGVPCTSEKHMHTVPLVDVTPRGMISIFVIDVAKSKDMRQLCGHKVVVGNMD